jgi:acetyltransferase
MSVRHLEYLLEPRCVAIVGASDRPASVGATVWRNLHSGGFTGPVWPLNLRLSALDGVPVFKRLADLPGVPDLVVVCTPPQAVAGVIAEAGAKGAKAAIVMTAGLTPAQRQAMLDAARPHLLRVLGPNCIGASTPRLGLNASFAHTDALPGEIAFVSQSGALLTAVLDWARSRGIGFSRMVSLGERADVDFGDLLDWLASDRHTRSILLYIESVETPRKFLSAARAAARNKPVIVVKAGRAGGGVQAAASHTGAMAGSDLVFDAAIRRAGMLRVETLADLFMAAQTLARFASNRSERLTIMTNGGGAGVMAADAAALGGIALAPLSNALRGKLDALLPPTWSHGNPIDIIGDAPAERYVGTLRALLEDNRDAVLFMHAPTAIVPAETIARACLPLVHEHPGRVMACWLGDRAVATARRLMQDAGVPDYATPEEAVRAFSLLSTYRRNQRTLLETPRATPTVVCDRAAARAIVERVLAGSDAGASWLSEPQAKQVLSAYGIPVVATAAVPADVPALLEAAERIGYPLALKIVSPDITHKSEVGGVALNLTDRAALEAAATTMLATLRTRRPEARIEGFSVQTMANRPQAQELIVGASVDAAFGPVLLFGEGGTAVEVLADRAIALPPLNEALAREMVARTRVAKRLAGYRDRPPADMAALCGVLVSVSQMLADLPELAELDINPLWADADGVLALDARIRIDVHAGAGAERFAIRPYPDQFEEAVEWAGRTVVLRPIRPEDEPHHRAFMEHLSPADLRLRFFNARRELPHSELARLTQIDYAREMAFIAVGQGEAGPETLGVVRAVADPDNVEAEFAIIVRTDLKGMGLGHLLLDKMVRYCHAQGTQRLVALVLRENDPMLGLARELGFEVDRDASDSDALRLVLSLAPPTVAP